MTDVAFVFLRMLLVILWLCSVSHIFCDGADLIEPLALIIALVIASQITLQDLCCISVADLFRDLIGDHEIIIEEIADEIKDLLCINQVFSRFVARSSQIQDLCDIFFVPFKILQSLRLVFSYPFGHEFCKFGSRNAQEHVLRNVVQLVDIEQSAAAAHFCSSKFKVLHRSIRIFDAPFLEVGVQNGQQVFLDCLRVIALFFIVIQGQFRILSLAQLSFVAVVQLQKLCCVAVGRHFKSQFFKQFHMDRQGHEPLFAADYMSRAHKVIVDGMSKVISRDTIGL